jgi:hypothetical protein
MVLANILLMSQNDCLKELPVARDLYLGHVSYVYWRVAK